MIRHLQMLPNKELNLFISGENNPIIQCDTTAKSVQVQLSGVVLI